MKLRLPPDGGGHGGGRFSPSAETTHKYTEEDRADGRQSVIIHIIVSRTTCAATTPVNNTTDRRTPRRYREEIYSSAFGVITIRPTYERRHELVIVVRVSYISHNCMVNGNF